MRTLVVATNKPRDIPGLIVYVRFVAACMEEDDVYASLAPLVATLKEQTAALEAAHVKVMSGLHGTRAARDAVLQEVRSTIGFLQHGVERLANGNPDKAPAIITGAGMLVKDVKGPHKLPFVVKRGRVSGEVRIYVRAAKSRASYEWQYSLDGVTWQSVPTTTGAHTVISGLTPGKLYSFRYRVISKGITSNWSDVVTHIVT